MTFMVGRAVGVITFLFCDCDCGISGDNDHGSWGGICGDS